MRRRTVVTGSVSALITAVIAAFFVWFYVFRKKARTPIADSAEVESNKYVKAVSASISGYALYEDVAIAGKGRSIDFHGYFGTIDAAKKACDALTVDLCHYIVHKKSGKDVGYYVYGIRDVELEEVGRFVVRNPDITDVYLRLN